MRGLTTEQKNAYVEKKAEERKKVQAEIAKLAAERESFLAAERAKLAKGPADTFDSAVKRVIAAQMGAKGFALEAK